MIMEKKVRPPRLNPRKRPTQARATYTMGVILEAAAHILDKRDVSAYTTNAIAERAGVSIGSLYQYFPNKDAITMALIDRETTFFLRDMERVAVASSGLDALQSMVGIAVTHQIRRPQLARVLDQQEGAMPSQYRDAQVEAALLPLVVRVLQQILPASNGGVMVAAGDMMTITRALTDAAGARGEADEQVLMQRILRALHGYLGISPPVDCAAVDALVQHS